MTATARDETARDETARDETARDETARSPRFTPYFERVRHIGDLLAPADLAFAIDWPTDGPAPDFLVHLSCNTHYVPHIALMAQRILERMGFAAPIIGGPENCCGTIHRTCGEEVFATTAARTASHTFARTGAARLLTICPDCDDNFSAAVPGASPLAVENVSAALVEHLDRLRPHLSSLDARVVVHDHADSAVRLRDHRNIVALMEAIPGVTVTKAEHAGSASKHCSVLNRAPVDAREAMAAEAAALGADILVMPYHSCYRTHAVLEADHPFEVQHYLGVLARAMGISFEEPYKALRKLKDLDAAVDRLAATPRGRTISRETLYAMVAMTIYAV